MNKNEHKPMNSDQLRTFLVIAKQGHLTAASDILNRTQSAISVQLRKLEQELGVTLFHRTPHGMTLTPSGETLLPKAQAAVSDLSQMRRMFDDPLTGALRVGIPDDFDDVVLERVLVQFIAHNPQVEIVATSGCTSKFGDMIKQGQLDIAVISGAASRDDRSFSAEEIVWATAKTKTHDPEAKVPLVLLDRNCWWKDIATAALNRANIAYRIAFKSSSFASQKSAIRAGIGIGILPKGSLDTTMRTLAADDGFPPLPTTHRSIVINPTADKTLTTAMATAFENWARAPVYTRQHTGKS